MSDWPETELLRCRLRAMNMSEMDWWGCSWTWGGERFSDERTEIGDDGTETVDVREQAKSQLTETQGDRRAY